MRLACQSAESDHAASNYRKHRWETKVCALVSITGSLVAEKMDLEYI